MKSTTAKTVTLDPGMRAFVEEAAEKGGPPIYTLTPEAARGVLEHVQSAPPPRPRGSISSLALPGGVRTTLFRPEALADSTRLSPAVVYLHGGGWMLGSVRTHEYLVASLAAAARATVVFVEYSLAPEAQFPDALEETYLALQYIAEHGGAHGIDGERLAVAGDSAGGNLATAAAMLTPMRGGARLLAQALFYPVIAANFSTDSYEEFADGLWLTRSAMTWFWEAYAPSEAERRLPEASPLLAPSELLSRLPSTLLITAEADVLRDEGEAYAARLMDAGVPTQGIRYLGAIHDFVMLHGVAATPPARHAIATAGAFLREHLYA